MANANSGIDFSTLPGGGLADKLTLRINAMISGSAVTPRYRYRKSGCLQEGLVMSSVPNKVVEYFQGIVQPDGGELELVGAANGVASFSYLPGQNEKCVSCVLTAEDLKELMLEALQAQDRTITAVEIIVRNSRPDSSMAMPAVSAMSR